MSLVIALVVSLMYALPCSAESTDFSSSTPIPGRIAYRLRGSTAAPYGFVECTPGQYDDDPNRRWPLIIQLHGGYGTSPVEFPNQLEELTHQYPLLHESEGRHFPAVILAPLSTFNEDGYIGIWDNERVSGFIDFALANYRIDTRRVYVTGASTGGGCTWNIAMRASDRIAAIVPVCGSMISMYAPFPSGVSVWGFVNGDDFNCRIMDATCYDGSIREAVGTINPIRDGNPDPVTRTMTASLTSDRRWAWSEGVSTVAAPGQAPYPQEFRYTIFPTGGHDSSTAAYHSEAMWDWLFHQLKAGNASSPDRLPVVSQAAHQSPRGATSAGTPYPAATALAAASDGVAIAASASGVQPMPRLNSGAVTVRDYGAVGDGQTDDWGAIQAAIDATAEAGGGTVRVPATSNGYVCNRPLVLKKGVNLVGDGMAHRAFWVAGTVKRGSVLLIKGTPGGDCISFEGDAYGYHGIADLSVYDNSDAPIRAVVGIRAVQSPFLINVEIGCVGSARGIGLQLADLAMVPTLYGMFRGVSTDTVETGLQLYNDANAHSFVGCRFDGTKYSVQTDGSYSIPKAIDFSGCSFESTYSSATQDIAYVESAQNNVHGWSAQPGGCYVAKFCKLVKGSGITFGGCYFENGASPATYDDGAHGSLNLASVVSLESSPDLSNVTFTGCYFAAFLLDLSCAGTRADSLPHGRNYSTQLPARASVRANAQQNVADATYTKIDFATRYEYDATQVSFDDTAKEARILERGTYLINAMVGLNAFAASASYMHIRINATSGMFYGPNNPKGAVFGEGGCQATAVLTCNVGDTVAIEAFQNSGETQTVATADHCYLQIVKISN